MARWRMGKWERLGELGWDGVGWLMNKAHTDTHIHTHTCAHVCAHTHTHMHTHAHEDDVTVGCYHVCVL